MFVRVAMQCHRIAMRVRVCIMVISCFNIVVMSDKRAEDQSLFDRDRSILSQSVPESHTHYEQKPRQLPKRWSHLKRTAVTSELPTDDMLVRYRWQKQRRQRRSNQPLDAITECVDCHRQIVLFLAGRRTTIIVEPNTHLFSPEFEIITVSQQHRARRETVAVERHAFVRGDVIGAYDSSVSLYMYPNGNLRGTVFLNDVVYAIEPASLYEEVSGDDMIMYDSTVLEWDATMGVRPQCVSVGGSDSSSHNNDNDTIDVTSQRRRDHERQRHRRGPPADGNTTCTVLGVADSVYFESNNNDLAGTITSILSDMAFVNTIFKRALFNDVSYGIVASKVIVYQDALVDPYRRAFSTPSEMLTLMGIPQSDGLVQHSEFCLVHFFTSFTFDGGVQGFGHVGVNGNGICNHFGNPNVESYTNIAWTSDLNSGIKYPILMRMLVTAHEVAHNFGSLHDGGDCAPSADDGGKYLMFAISVAGSQVNNAYLSSCSLNQMSDSIRNHGACFAKPAFGDCGNGLWEPGGLDGDVSTTSDNEECDSGNRTHGDACCDVGCTLKAGAVCSDRNQRCCGNCSFASADTVCYSGFDNDMDCKNTTYCDGVTAQCPQAVENIEGTACGDKGACVANEDVSQRCQHWCLHFGADSCACEAPQDCEVCCKNNEQLEPYCPASSTFDVAANDCTYANNTRVAAIRPFTSECSTPPSSIYNNSEFLNSSGGRVYTSDLFLNAFALCGNGLCDGAGKCVAVDEDLLEDLLNDLSGITAESLWTFAQINIVGATTLLLGVPWLLVSCLCCLRDGMQRHRVQDTFAKAVVEEHKTADFNLTEDFTEMH
eukprot:m.192151 g.192151  ORF g.192151 m.192151 type:complete len:826 (+) comp32453_c0_seq1:201-2678(+)